MSSRAPHAGQWSTLLTVCLGYFMASWAMAPVASILPTIARDLDVSVTEVGWTMNAYFLLLVGLVLIMGRLGDALGYARIFGSGIGLFTVGLVLCALSTNFVSLLLARAVQGVGSAMIFATSLAIIATAIPGRSRGKAIGVLTTAQSGATLAGVAFSTWAVQTIGWHWTFVVPVPIGILGAILGWRLSLPASRSVGRRIDWAGGVLLFGTLTAAMLGLNHLHEGPESFVGGAPYHLGMHVVALVLLLFFLRVERRAAAPLLSFKLLHNGAFTAGITGNGIAHMSMLATVFLIPFLLERGRGQTPSDTGLLLMTQQVALVAGSVLLGSLYDRTRWPVIAVVTMGGLATGLSLLGLVGGGLPYVALLGIVVLLGSSLGGFTTVNNTGIMALAPQDQRGFASGLVETTRQFGHSIGVSLSSSFMGAAIADAVVPAPVQYVAGFQQAALAMGMVAAVGVVTLSLPLVRAWLSTATRDSAVAVSAEGQQVR